MTNTVRTETPSEFPYVVTKGNSTVKIYHVNSPKNKAGHYFQVCDLTGERRKLISFAAFADAKSEAERIVKKVRAGDLLALEMGGSQRAEYGKAKETLAPTGTSLILATAHFTEAFKILGCDKIIDAARFYMARYPASMPSKTVPELVIEMLEVKRTGGHAPRYIEDLKSRLTRFQIAFPGKLADVETQSVQKWLDKLDLSNQSYNNYRTVAQSLFSFAEKRGYIAKGTNPLENVERAKAKPGAMKIFTPAEFTALLHAASPDFLPMLAIGGFAGLRSAEMQRLSWSDIDLKAGWITVDASKAKTASRRTVPIGAALAAWLKDFKGATGEIWGGNDDSLCDAQYRTAKAAGIQWKANALRHSYASYRLSELGDVARTAIELGNSPTIVHRHYKELVRPEEAKAWFSILP